MLKQPGGILLYVSDLDKARAWYSEVLEVLPRHADQNMICFRLGDCDLMLVQGATTPHEKSRVYWAVSDVAQEYRRITGSELPEARAASEVENLYTVAEVVDPFGNVVGLMAKDPLPLRDSATQRAVEREALLNVRSTVDAFQTKEEAQKRTIRRVFQLLFCVLAVFVLVLVGNHYLYKSNRADELRNPTDFLQKK
jgi:predicted enzyme related to lactoylglutathione lyase